VHFDMAVATRSEAKSEAAIARLKELEPGLMTHLLSATRSDAADFVAVNYPY
jgi:hypothetical protein